jgi:hypothetical protein
MPVPDSHDKLIALPLTIITAFCFSFVLIQPIMHPHKDASASNGSPLTASRDQAISPIHVKAPAKLNKLTVGSASGSSQSNSSFLDSRQASNLQSANQNNHGNHPLIIHLTKGQNLIIKD